MRAALLREGSATLALEEVALAEPVGREVVVRTAAVGLCHSDYHVVDGTLVRPRPILLGHEAAGVVAAVGPEVRTVAVGDHVVTCLVMGCGDCARCDAGDPARCSRPDATRRVRGAPARLTCDGQPVGVMTNIGALAESMLVDERALTVVPSTVPFRLACLLGCAVVTGLGAVFNVARVQPGETVAVIGCGGVGLNVVQGARIAGARRIVAIDLNPGKLQLARRLGATDVIDGSGGDPLAAALAIVGDGVDHAFEVVGRPSTVRQAHELAAPGRRAYALGIQSDDAEVTLSALGLRRGKSLTGVFMGDTVPSRDIPRYVELWQRGELDLESMVSNEVSLDAVNDGFARMADGATARTVVTLPGP
jgi:S-(hydroxymethyl)glutathione dehydrogenase/alcohol dehydrogenase